MVDLDEAMRQASIKLECALSWFNSVASNDEVDRAILHLNGVFTEIDGLYKQALAIGTTGNVVMRRLGA